MVEASGGILILFHSALTPGWVSRFPEVNLLHCGTVFTHHNLFSACVVWILTANILMLSQKTVRVGLLKVSYNEVSSRNVNFLVEKKDLKGSLQKIFGCI